MAKAALGSFEILFELEPIVKLICKNINCRFNLVNAANAPETKKAACNLKQITIDSNGICKNYEEYNPK